MDGMSLLRDPLPLAFAVRLGTVALSLAFARWPRWCRIAAFAGSAVASSLAAAAAAPVLLTGVSREGVLLRHDASGITFGHSVTPLSAWFLLVLALLAIPAAVYSIGYLSHAVSAERTAFVAAGFNVLLGAMEAVCVVNSVVACLFA